MEARKTLGFRFCLARNLREGADIFFHGCGDGFVEDELTFASCLDETGIGKGLEMMRDSSGSDSLKGGEIAAIHFVAGGDGLINHEAGLVAQGLGNTLDLFAIHDLKISSQATAGSRQFLRTY